jgi:hypothetical protein
MKTFASMFLGSVLFLLAAGSQERKPQAQTLPVYDVSHQETFTGSVQDVRDYKCPVSGSVGAHLTVKGLAEVIEIHLAPSAFLKEYEIKFKAGDKVAVVGTRVTFEGKPALLARSVRVGQETYIFRDEKGRPLW